MIAGKLLEIRARRFQRFDEQFHVPPETKSQKWKFPGPSQDLYDERCRRETPTL